MMLRKMLFHTLLLAAGTLSLASAQKSGTDALSALATLPKCAMDCILTSASHSLCAITNQTCLCADQKFQDDGQVCVLANCTVKESLFTKNVTTTVCNSPIRNRQALFSTTSNTLAVISAVVVSVRLGFKLVNRIPFGLDDWLIIATFFVGLPNTIINIQGTTAHGLGLDIWTLSFDEITAFALWTFVQEPIYFAVLTFLKLSLLAFFIRIFPFQPIRWILLATFVFTCLYGIVFVLVAIFQCRPISFIWTRWTGEDLNNGHCLDINRIAWANAGISIALDIWMLAIPLHQIRKLQLHWKKKVGAMLMFCVGTFVTVVSILRLQALLTYANSINPTWDNWDTSNWSTIEINVGIMCACMPALRLLLVRIFPVLRGSTAQYGNRLSDYHMNRNKSSSIPESSVRNPSMGRTASDTEIVRTDSFTVEHGPARDNDEASLVHMQDLGWKSSKNRGIRSNISAT